MTIARALVPPIIRRSFDELHRDTASEDIVSPRFLKSYPTLISRARAKRGTAFNLAMKSRSATNDDSPSRTVLVPALSIADRLENTRFFPSISFLSASS